VPAFRCRIASDDEIVHLPGPQMQIARHARRSEQGWCVWRRHRRHVLRALSGAVFDSPTTHLTLT
jgi:hypothetical protein